MENSVVSASGMSKSLTNRDVYCVCYPQRDGMDALCGELTAARKKFFTEGKKAVKVGKSKTVKGYDGKLRGKLTRHNLYWKKEAGKTPLEEAFQLKTGYVVVRRDFRGVIVSRAFFDRDHRWVKSEYYEPWDSADAQVTFKPVGASDLVERFDRDRDGSNSRSTELHPLPYLSGTAEQSILDAQFGEPMLIISTAEGMFCYCPKREARQRLHALDDIREGSIVLMPAWEVRDGALARDEGEEDTAVSFSSLEEYARVEPGQDASPSAPSPAVPPDAEENEEFTDLPEQESAPAAPEEPVGEKSIPEGSVPTVVRDGRLSGPAGESLAAYRGEYRDGKREGFGAYYDKNGSLSYAGFWKDGKKEGMGVSFRDSDHALHISNWENGRPGEFVSLFDGAGNLRYGGRIVDGKKQGAGVSFDREDGSIFVGRWEDGKPTGLGSSFDRDGRLLYYGEWKDGRRSGRGTEFDGSGGIVFDGEWKDGKYHNGILYQKLSDDAE